MNSGRTVFSQLMNYLPTYEFQKCVNLWHLSVGYTDRQSLQPAQLWVTRIAKVFNRTVVLYNGRPSAVNQVRLHPIGSTPITSRLPGRQGSLPRLCPRNLNQIRRFSYE